MMRSKMLSADQFEDARQILRDIDGQPYHFDIYVSPSQRNHVLEEVAKEFDKMQALGDTAASFACFVRGMKT
jgi:hypothetical protein